MTLNVYFNGPIIICLWLISLVLYKHMITLSAFKYGTRPNYKKYVALSNNILVQYQGSYRRSNY